MHRCLRSPTFLVLIASLGLATAATAGIPIPARFRCAPKQADAGASYPYPYPPDASAGGARTDNFAWSGLGGGDSGGFGWGGLDVRSGEVTRQEVGARFVKKFDAKVTPGPDAEINDEMGRGNDVWNWSGTPKSFSFPASLYFYCTDRVCAVTTYRDAGGGDKESFAVVTNPPFDPNAPDAYPTSQYGAHSGSLSVATTFVPGKGTVSYFDERAEATVSLRRFPRAWTTTELLAKRVEPQVRPLPPENGTPRNQMVVPNPQPRFGFPIVEAGHASQYHHFNYYQELLAYRINSTGPNDGILLTSEQLAALPSGSKPFGRGYGEDPRIGGQFGLPADRWPLYWDEEPIAGRDGQGGTVDFRWQSRAHGTFFQDIPGLPLEGHRATFIAYLVGVGNDGFCDVFAKQGLPNSQDFVFRWSYLQRRRVAPAGSGLFIPRLENADASLPDVGEGDAYFEGFGEGDGVVNGPTGGFDLDGDGVPSAIDTCPDLNDPEQRDSDADGLGDACDNCRLAANPTQMDGDFDGFGNACDADLNNDNVVNFGDLALLKQVIFTQDPVADLNADGVVNFADVALLKKLFFKPPGPNAQTP